MIDIIKIYNEGQSDYFLADILGLWIGKCSKTSHSVSINDLLLESEYNFIPTLEKSEEYNRAFELWLKDQTKKDFSIISHKGKYYLVMDIKEVVTNVLGEVKFPMPDEMLLGYHIEFIKKSIRSK